MAYLLAISQQLGQPDWSLACRNSQSNRRRIATPVPVGHVGLIVAQASGPANQPGNIFRGLGRMETGYVGGFIPQTPWIWELFGGNKDCPRGNLGCKRLPAPPRPAAESHHPTLRCGPHGMGWGRGLSCPLCYNWATLRRPSSHAGTAGHPPPFSVHRKLHRKLPGRLRRWR